MIKTRILLLLTAVLIQGCAQVDDYLLGKDNTPKPQDLKPIDDKIKVSQNWSTAAGKPRKVADYLKLKPVIHDHIIYTADASGMIQAVNNKIGKALWTTQLKHGVLSGPTVSEGYIAVSTNAATLVLLNQNTGKELWEIKMSGEVLAPPAISHHKVIAKTVDDKAYAFDVDNGKQLWSADHGSPNLVLKASSSPIILGDLVLVGFSDGKLDAFDIQTGQIMWQRSIAYASGFSDVDRLVDIDADPIIKDKVAYLASYQGYIGALSLTNGEFLWKKAGSVYKNIVLRGDTLYFTDSDDVVWSLNRHTGTVNWKQTSLKARGLTEPVMVGKNLVVGDKSGYLHFLEPQTGDVLARSQLSGGVSTSPSAQGKNLYVLTDNGLLNQLSVS